LVEVRRRELLPQPIPGPSKRDRHVRVRPGDGVHLRIRPANDLVLLPRHRDELGRQHPGRPRLPRSLTLSCRVVVDVPGLARRSLIGHDATSSAGSDLQARARTGPRRSAFRVPSGCADRVADALELGSRNPNQLWTDPLSLDLASRDPLPHCAGRHTLQGGELRHAQVRHRTRAGRLQPSARSRGTLVAIGIHEEPPDVVADTKDLSRHPLTRI
jgi:hypothetical protein